MSNSTIKAEYIVIRYVASKVVWIHQFIHLLKLDIIPGIKLLGDNKINITLIKNSKSQHQIKHINIQYHYIR